MSLSNEIEDFNDDRYSKSIKVEDVKEFIRLLKERDFKLDLEQLRKLDKLAGDKLI